MIDFKTDPRFNLPETANVATMPVEVIGQYMPDCGPNGGIGDSIFYAGDFTNRAVALIELQKLCADWKNMNGLIEWVDPITIKMLNGKTFQVVAFYTIDMLPVNTPPEEWDK